MSTRLNRWGHSVGLRLPAAVLAASGLSVGRSVSIRVLDNGDVRVRPIGKIEPAESGDTDTATAKPTESESELAQW
ncbi:AbrB/MazE/SpoVT family DNA-binding domain-containing protein [Rhodoferax bucti]|uniref:AbrB/MazE/SpoVT family DNA-binding domain-containing protein n=1 Tax=Rhodoferax bucti TaxID=2576305 RepID=UPI001108853D|nr:AbrB/MazE/SpoVT family DNA-binding domain-containing protein [Rhodoferax bucti]